MNEELETHLDGGGPVLIEVLFWYLLQGIHEKS
jgi:hypothetical protein